MTSAVERLEEPVVVMGREFELVVFPTKEAWSARMRRPLLSLPSEDARLIERKLAGLVREANATLAEYV